jgi:hypothetical protein
VRICWCVSFGGGIGANRTAYYKSQPKGILTSLSVWCQRLSRWPT